MKSKTPNDRPPSLSDNLFTKPLQARLRVGPQDDAHEQEANQVAAGMFSGGNASLPSQSPVAGAQKAEPDKDRAALLEGQINEAKGGGQPLSGDVKRHMEPAFNTDFSRVKVHTGSKAEALNSRINAYAFTYDNNIFYGKGQQPGINPLTAHELTHVAQQQGNAGLSTRPVYPPAKQAQRNKVTFQKDIGEFTSTDTKSNLRGKAPQQKVSRQESAGTLRSCGGSPSFRPPKGHKNTKLKGAFGDFEIEHGLDKQPSGTDFGQYFFKMEMTPNKATEGSKIGFVQTIRSGTATKWSTDKDDPGMGEDRAKRATKEGWWVDRANAARDKTPFYGMTRKTGKLKETPTTRIGEYKGARPMLFDTPGVMDPDYVQFASTAMDMSTGANYGTVGWGYEYDGAKSHYKEETPRLLDAKDPRMKGRDEAFKKWNDVVATKDSGIDKIPGI